MNALDRSRRPARGTMRPFALPLFLRRRLPNGLELLLAPRPDGEPLARLALLSRGGAGEGAPPGAASLAASLLDEGTARRSGPDLAATVERLGGSLGSGADWNAVSVSAAILAEHLDETLALVAEVAQSATLPEAEVERLRQQTLAELLRRRDQPAARAEEAFLRLLYGDSPYGYPLLGTPESVATLERRTLGEFAARCLAPARSALVLAGRFDADAATRRLEAEFGSWTATAPAPAVPPVPGGRPRRILIVDRPGAAQTELRLGHVGVPRRHPDRTALAVANGVLGGKFTSRINLNLRERLGLTYGASSRFADRLGSGPFVIATAVATSGTGQAVAETLAEVARLRDEPAGADEISETIDYLIGVFPYPEQATGDLAQRLEELAVFELADDYFPRYLADLAAVDGDTVQRVARAHLRPDEMSIVAVGAAAEIAPQLEGFGPVEVAEA